ncbi:NAD(P)/FAD-dependent oxidoreductase [Chitinophaga lutea]
MDLQSGYCYSLVRYGLICDYPRLERDLRTDVAVIGAGISGALAAHALVQAGVECVSFDARTVGLGSTCASTSLLQYEIDTPLCRLRSLIGRAAADRAYALSVASVAQLAKVAKRVGMVNFEPKTSLLLASYKKDAQMLASEFKARREIGLDVTFWDETTLRNNTGLQAPAAIYSHTAAQTDAYLFTHRIHQYNIRRGARVYDRTPVTDLQPDKQGVVLRTAAGHTIRARKVIVATGYEATQYIREKLATLRSTYAVASEHMDDGRLWYENCLIWETKDPYLYLRTTQDHRILAGGRDEMFYSPARRDKLLKSKCRALVQDVHKRFPHLDMRPEFSWTGTFASTHDGLPYIGEYPGLPHAYFALGYGGNGITFSQIAAQLLAAQIQDKKAPDAGLFTFDRFKGQKA